MEEPELPEGCEMLTREQVARTRQLHASTDAAELLEAAVHPDHPIRVAAARNPHTPAESVLNLATRDTHPQVIEEALDNPACPIQALIRTVVSADRFTSRKAATVLLSTRYRHLCDYLTDPTTPLHDLITATYANDTAVEELAYDALRTIRAEEWQEHLATLPPQPLPDA